MSNPSGERLDHYLVRTGHAASRRDAREMVARGAVWLNGRRGIKGALVHSGDNVEVEAPSAVAAIEPEAEIPIDVLFEDPALIVVNKPGGIPCHPLRPGERGTVMNAVVARFPETAAIGDKPIEGGLIHRLDNGTSGALMIARTADAFATVRRAIRSGAIKRKYLALVSGNLKMPMTLAATDRASSEESAPDDRGIRPIRSREARRRGRLLRASNRSGALAISHWCR